WSLVPVPCALLHAVIARPAATLRRNPVHNLVRVLNIARLAVDAIRKVDLKLLARRRRFGAGVIDNLIHCRLAVVLAGIAILLQAARSAEIEVVDNKMRRLVL